MIVNLLSRFEVKFFNFSLCISFEHQEILNSKNKSQKSQNGIILLKKGPKEPY